jgi:hypothetical protein
MGVGTGVSRARCSRRNGGRYRGDCGGRRNCCAADFRSRCLPPGHSASCAARSAGRRGLTLGIDKAASRCGADHQNERPRAFAHHDPPAVVMFIGGDELSPFGDEPIDKFSTWQYHDGRGFRGLVKQALIAVLLVGVASALAHLHVVAQSYYPVVQVKSPEGLVFTAVQDATSERGDCAAANHRFLAPFKSMCSDCRVMVARCERELQGVEAALSNGKSIPHHQISAPGLHLAIAGPEAAASSSCNHIARSSTDQRTLRCVPPQRPAKS